MSTPPDQASPDDDAPSRTSFIDTTRPSVTGRRSSIMMSISNLFVKAAKSGPPGQSVEDIGGTTGADFEAFGGVTAGRGGGGGGICCCFRDPDVREYGSPRRYILVKGSSCFVYEKDTSLSPLYAIKLAGSVPVVPSAKGKYQVVTLESALGDAKFSFTFDINEENSEIIQSFISVVRRAAVGALVEEKRRELGHGDLINKRASVAHADMVGVSAAARQPSQPIDAKDHMEMVSKMADGMIPSMGL